MPELPEVHTILQDLKQIGLLGCTIERAKVYWARTVAFPSPSHFCQLINYKQILELSRRGKYLIFHLSDTYFLCIHLRMTGKLLLVNQNTLKSPYIRLSLDLNNGKTLDYHDTRKFGRWYLTQNLESIFKEMGPEPLSLDFNLEAFYKQLRKRSRALKPLLLDQKFLAGLGNIYIDEALWEAHLHPLQPACSLTFQQAQELHQAIIYVLEKGIKNQGTTLGSGQTNYHRLDWTQGKHQNLLNVFRRTGQNCPRCGHLIERLKVAQRSSHICINCQPMIATNRKKFLF